MASCSMLNDASYSAPASLSVPTNCLSFEHINIIEPDLEDYELCSLIFLLYDNVDTAYERLHMIELMKTEGIDMNQLRFSGYIFDWAQAMKDQNIEWKNMLLEALCVIQSYALLRKLGFNKEEMIQRFLPHNCECSLFLNRVKKVLYRMCEDLSIEETKKLISTVNDDLKAKHFPTKEIYDERYLEIYILYWATVHYITISDKSIDLTNLLQILKRLEMDIHYDRLKNSIKLENDTFLKTVVPKRRIKDAGGNENNTMSSIRSSVTDSEPETNNFSVSSNIDNSQIYKMDPNNAGIVVIINQINFKNLPNASEVYDTRNGTDKDKDRLIKIFRKFGFRIIVHEDLEHCEILREIEADMMEFKAKDCCFIVAILSHGKTGLILGTDCYGVELTEIEDCIQNTEFKKLLGKPKILIIQACQGKPRQKEIPLTLNDLESNDSRDIEEEKMNLVYDGPVNSVPEKADFLVISATVSGYAAVRDQKKGSWFIQTFCQLLEEEGERTHLEDIIISTKNKVAEKRWDRTCLVPESRSTLTKRLFFKTVPSPVTIENEDKPL